jgi:hypothetical protein
MESKLMIKNARSIILDIISKYRFPINDFFFGKKVNLYHIHMLYSFSDDDVRMEIWQLLREGLVEINSDISFSFFDSFKEYNFDSSVLLGLTALGGEKWEEVFNPNWFNYVEVIYDDLSYENPVTIELRSLNEKLLEKILTPLKLVNAELQFKLIGELQPCYWKKINTTSCYLFQYTAQSLEEKIVTNNIYNSLSDYSKDFCHETNYFL